MWIGYMVYKQLKKLGYASILLMLFSFFSLQVYAQQLDSDQIKAAYLFNFLKHVQWPESNKKNSYVLAIYQDPISYQNIKDSLNNQRVKNRPISVLLVDKLEQAAEADLVFVSVQPSTDLANIAASLRRTETLLVTDNSLDKHNVMINLSFNQKTSAVAFEVNKSNIIYEHLNMSAELLLLGGTEIDVAELYRETEVAMQSMRQREVELNNTLENQSKQLNVIGKRLQSLNDELKSREEMAKQRQVELIALKKNIAIQEQSIIGKENQLAEVVNQLSAAKTDLTNKQQAADEKEQENRDMAVRILANKHILDQQQAQLDKQGLQLNQKNEQLAVGKERIEQQRFYITLLAGVIATAVLFSILVVWLFAKNKKTTSALSRSLDNLKKMQDQLVQSEKLASLGQLTAGVAHEINTPLGIAVTSTSSILDRTKAIKMDFDENNLTKSSLEQYFHTTIEAVELNMSSLNRVIGLLSNFKQVAADQVVGEIRTFNLTAYIDEVMRTLSAEMKRFRVDYRYQGADDIQVKTVPGALAQVLTNLVTNSLKHGFESRDNGNISIVVTESANDVQLLYIDDGEGMNDDVLENIFEPFFTTKRSSGTGLGMNIVYNIINKKLKGEITAESNPQQGTSFIISLPKNLEE